MSFGILYIQYPDVPSMEYLHIYIYFYIYIYFTINFWAQYVVNFPVRPIKSHQTNQCNRGSLMRFGAEIEALTSKGRSALDIAMSSQQNAAPLCLGWSRLGRAFALVEWVTEFLPAWHGLPYLGVKKTPKIFRDSPKMTGAILLEVGDTLKS